MTTVETLTLPAHQTPDGAGWTLEAGNLITRRWVRPVHVGLQHRPAPFFTSDSGRTVATLDRAGMQRLAEEHEWMRDRIVQLETENARLRSMGLLIVARPVECFEAATAG